MLLRPGGSGGRALVEAGDAEAGRVGSGNEVLWPACTAGVGTLSGSETPEDMIYDPVPWDGWDVRGWDVVTCLIRQGARALDEFYDHKKWAKESPSRVSLEDVKEIDRSLVLEFW